jgi:serine protease Do
MIRFLFIGILLILFSTAETGFASGVTSIGNYPLPLLETEVMITRWLQHHKYNVSSEKLADGQILLRGALSEKLLTVSIRPNSPLATKIELLDTLKIEDLAAIKTSLELFLAKYGQADGVKIPEQIRSLTTAVVCLSAPQSEDKKMNFTGFFINNEGTVLTIAHDFDKLRDFKLSLSDGVIGKGHLLKSDVAKDLSVINSDYREYKTFFSLTEGRTKLSFGDHIFMLYCNSNGKVLIQSGEIDKPKASVAGQTLLQVKLEQVFFGSSGSPVVDEQGKLVGVVKGRFRGANSRGFLIPVDTVRSFVGMGKK